ncbi:MAG: YidC/Oxa1 family membrane protein insertase [Bacillota bacterium]|nr:YidC/Oxa1 family membrane protein insertase [Bacillota bacterium]
MIDAIAQFFGVVLSFIYEYIPNFGAAIIIMTVLVKLVTFPLNNKQIQSAKRMQLMQPEMKKIQEKYKDDKEKQNKAMTEFMQENNINPLAGCLPLLVQFPILIGIFRLLREANAFLDMSKINPFLFPNIAAESLKINLLELPYAPGSEGFSLEGIIGQLGVLYLFPLIAGATTYLYSKMSTPAEGSQKMMLYMMPIMITVFSFSFPIGLVIYWIMNNLFSIGQHLFISKMDNSSTKDEGSDGKGGRKAFKKKETKVLKDSDGGSKQDNQKKADKLQGKSSKKKSTKGKGKK